MIKINLASSAVSAIPAASAGVYSADGFSSPEQIRRDALLRILIIMAGPALLYFYEMQSLPAKLNELASKQQMLAELQVYNQKQAASVAEIKKFKEDEALIEARIAALEKISVDRQREVKVLELLQTVIPEKAWLTRIQLNPDGIQLQGLALSDFEVSAFLDALTRSVFLMDVNLLSSTEQVQDGVPLKKFEISCLLERPK